MTGKRISDWGLRIADLKRGAIVPRLRSNARALKHEGDASSPQSAIPNPKSKGFTLLELMIVIAILVILAMIAMAQYSKTVLAAKEATLKEDLFTMRKLIDQYAADKGKLPSSLDELQSAGYMHDIPVDPITDQKDWQVEFGDDPGSSDSSQGVVNVHSASTETASDGSHYSDW